MTPTQRARAICGEIEELIAASIELAVAEEREACAKVAAAIDESTAEVIAERIRQRGK